MVGRSKTKINLLVWAIALWEGLENIREVLKYFNLF